MQLLWNVVVSIIGSGLGTTAVGLLFKQKFDRELEIQKAFLTRASRVHERQVDTITKLYRHFFQAQGHLQRMTSATRLAAEVSDDEYRRLCAEAIVSALDILADGRLLLPPDLTQQCDLFFKALFHGQTDLAIAQHPAMVNGLQSAQFWEKAQKTAHEKVPKILQQIESAGRILVHGETPQPPRRTIGQKIRSVLHMKPH